MPPSMPFTGCGTIEGVEKKPATRELLNWIRALQADPDFRTEALSDGVLPYLGVLFKKSSDLEKAGLVLLPESLVKPVTGD